MMCGLSKPPFPLVAQPAAVIASDHRPGESRASPPFSPSVAVDGKLWLGGIVLVGGRAEALPLVVAAWAGSAMFLFG